jgi:DNA mismatch repair protein MLH3
VSLAISDGISFSHQSLLEAQILGQVDHKFICCILRSDTSRDTGDRVLVLLDQHAADERVSVEKILRELCDGFRRDGMSVTTLVKQTPRIVLSAEEAQLLTEPGMLALLRRWGIHLEVDAVPLSHFTDQPSPYVQVRVCAVPTTLEARLSRKEAVEVTRLVKLYLPVLKEGQGEIEALLAHTMGEGEVDWGRVLRWMPKEMLELANSKACRSASLSSPR